MLVLAMVIEPARLYLGAPDDSPPPGFLKLGQASEPV